MYCTHFTCVFLKKKDVASEIHDSVTFFFFSSETIKMNHPKMKMHFYLYYLNHL